MERGLKRWRQLRLQEIEELMLDLSEDFRDAQDGLGIAHRKPGEVAQDLIEYFWENLNRSATELARLEEEHEKLLRMDLPHLIVAFERSKKIKTYPWELEAWDLLTF